jgi:hypothetical protein
MNPDEHRLVTSIRRGVHVEPPNFVRWFCVSKITVDLWLGGEAVCENSKDEGNDSEFRHVGSFQVNSTPRRHFGIAFHACTLEHTRGLDSANLLYLSQVSCCELLLLHEGVDFAVECMEGASEGVLA